MSAADAVAATPTAVLPVLSVLSVLLPLLVAAAATVARWRSAVVVLAPLTCLPALALALSGLLPGGAGGAAESGVTELVDLPWLLLGTRLVLDDVSRPLLAVTALLYLVALAASRVERAEDPRRAGFTAVFLLTYAGNVLLLLAADVVTFYVGFTVMSLSAYGLVVQSRSATALAAGRVYLGLAIVGEALLLAGVLLVVRTAGTDLAQVPDALGADPDRGLTVALLVAGLGVKTGLVPLHVWLPLAHPAAPAPASAVLSGAMVKAGLVGWLRLLPLGTVAMPVAGTWLVVLGLAGVLLAVAVGLLQDDPKVQLAYSTVSQMGFMTVAVGAALIEPAVAATAVAVAVAYAVAHGAAKASLFLAVPVWHAARTPLRRGLTLAGVAVAGLGLAGLPPLGSYVAKYGLKEVAEAASVPSALLSLGAVGTTLLLARFALTLAAAPVDTPRPAGVVEAGWVFLLAGGPLMVWALASGADVPVPAADASTVWAGVWPVLLGGVLVGAVAVLPARTVPRPRWSVPAGDLVVVLEPAAGRLVGAVGEAGQVPGRVASGLGDRSAGWWGPVARVVDRLLLPDWSRIGPVSVGLLVLLVVVLL